MTGEHTGFGIASLVLGILAIVTCIFPFFIFGVLAIIFGSVAYWSKSKDSFGLAGFILGIIATAINVLILLLFYLRM